MNLDRTSVELKPRSHWQSMDLGFKLAKSQYKPLLTLWCILALPIYGLFKLIPALGIVALILWWWLKPLYEAPMYFWLSRAVFREPVSYRQCLSQLRKSLFTLLKTYLTLWRLGGSRSQNINVVVVEGAKGKAHRQRLSVFTRSNTQSGWLTFVCVNFEFVIYYALLIIGSMFLPGDPWRFFSIAPSFENDFSWYSLFSDLCYLSAAGIIAPFYVGAGFMLYINRRTHLEAWDIDVDFKRILLRNDNISQVSSASVTAPAGRKFGGLNGSAACLVLSLLAVTCIPPADAAIVPTAEESHQIIQEILDSKDFGEVEMVKRLRSKDRNKEEQEKEHSPLFTGLSNISDAVRLLLWGLVMVVALYLLFYGYKNRAALSSMFSELGFRRSRPETVLFDLEIAPESLPADIPGNALDLLRSGNQREAMGLLYRGALSRLVHQYGMQISRSATEQECVNQVEQNQPEIRRDAFLALTKLWLKSAYTRTALRDEDIALLCNQWPAAFDSPGKIS